MLISLLNVVCLQAIKSASTLKALMLRKFVSSKHEGAHSHTYRR